MTTTQSFQARGPAGQAHDLRPDHWPYRGLIRSLLLASVQRPALTRMQPMGRADDGDRPNCPSGPLPKPRSPVLGPRRKILHFGQNDPTGKFRRASLSLVCHLVDNLASVERVLGRGRSVGQRLFIDLAESHLVRTAPCLVPAQVDVMHDPI